MQHIILYTRYGCGPCENLKKDLDRLGIAYEERYVPTLWEARTELYEVSGQCGVPVVVIEGKALVAPVIEEVENLVLSLRQGIE